MRPGQFLLFTDEMRNLKWNNTLKELISYLKLWKTIHDPISLVIVLLRVVIMKAASIIANYDLTWLCSIFKKY